MKKKKGTWTFINFQFVYQECSLGIKVDLYILLTQFHSTQSHAWNKKNEGETTAEVSTVGYVKNEWTNE